jgi:hypothetical protein
MKHILFALFIFISISAYTQTRYLDAYYVTFYDGYGNFVESNYVNDITFKLSDTNLIMGGGITFWFYGGTSISPNGTYSSMARPDDGSGNCRVAVLKTGSHTSTIKISWSNLVAVYKCRD